MTDVAPGYDQCHCSCGARHRGWLGHICYVYQANACFTDSGFTHRGLNPIVSTDSVHGRPGVQIHIVDSDLASAWNKANGIWSTFSNTDAVGQAIWAARSGPLYMGQMEDGRHKVIVEFQVFA